MLNSRAEFLPAGSRNREYPAGCCVTQGWSSDSCCFDIGIFCPIPWGMCLTNPESPVPFRGSYGRCFIWNFFKNCLREDVKPSLMIPRKKSSGITSYPKFLWCHCIDYLSWRQEPGINCAWHLSFLRNRKSWIFSPPSFTSVWPRRIRRCCPRTSPSIR